MQSWNFLAIWLYAVVVICIVAIHQNSPSFPEDNAQISSHSVKYRQRFPSTSGCHRHHKIWTYKRDKKRENHALEEHRKEFSGRAAEISGDLPATTHVEEARRIITERRGLCFL
jgi:hypothetical protein